MMAAATSNKDILDTSPLSLNLQSPIRCLSAMETGGINSVMRYHSMVEWTPPKKSLNLSKSFASTSTRTGFGSPSYPSPLDRIRIGHHNKPLEHGDENTFEANLNHSFPKASNCKWPNEGIPIESYHAADKMLQEFKGEGLHDVSFVSGCKRPSFIKSQSSETEATCTGASVQADGENWSFYNYVGGSQYVSLPSNVKNPNKAIVTVNAITSEILVANDMACELFAFAQEEMIGLKLIDLVTLKSKNQTTVSESHLECSGELVEVSGKVVDAVDSTGLVIPISLWVKKLDVHEPRCLVVMEPVERTTATIKFDHHGTIVDCDEEFACLHGYASCHEVQGQKLSSLIPSFKMPAEKHIPKDLRKQRATGRTKSGHTFPLSILIKVAETGVCSEAGVEGMVYDGVIWVFANISGLITVLPDGSIQSINANFSLMLFGYQKGELIGRDITLIIPGFFENIDDGDDEESDDELDHSIALPQLTDHNVPASSHCLPQGSQKCIEDDSSLATSPDVEAIPSSNANDSSCMNGTQPNQATDGPEHSVTSQREQEPFVSNGCSSVLRQTAQMSEIQSSAMAADGAGDADSCTCLHGGCGELEVEEMSASLTTGSNRREDCRSTTQLPVATDAVCQRDSDTNSASQPNNSTSAVRDNSQHTPCTHTEEGVSLCGDSQYDNMVDGNVPCEADVKPEKTSSVQTSTQDKLHNSSVTIVSPAALSEKCDGDDINCSQPPCVADNIEAASCETYAACSGQTESMFKTPEKSCHSAVSGANEMEYDLCQLEAMTAQLKLDSTSSPFPNKDHFNSRCNTAVSNSPVKSHRRSCRVDSVSSLGIQPGSYRGLCKHKDGSELRVLFQIKSVSVGGQTLYCVWVSRDPDDPVESHSVGNLTLASSLNSSLGMSFGRDTPNLSLGEQLGHKLMRTSLGSPRTRPVTPDCQHPLTLADEYEKHYETQQSIGKGAFGFVKLARRRRDNTEVVVKFIRRAKVLKDCWTDDKELGRVPIEVSLLYNLNHPNIVSLEDYFHGSGEFDQMVMEKHGSGMDLFEFIDRGPSLDEPLASYLFRQIVSAVSYLHSQNIVHRDIKDENIIINEKFIVKLIDFGSAARTEPGKLFGLFCGTLEYASPEVLLGNKYHGPELEMWSTGVTLYTLVFGENPFYDENETIKAILCPPFQVSQDLMEVLEWLLHPDPDQRATVQDMLRDSWVNQPVCIDHYVWHHVLPNTEFSGNTASDNRPETGELAYLEPHSEVLGVSADSCDEGSSFQSYGEQNESDAWL